MPRDWDREHLFPIPIRRSRSERWRETAALAGMADMRHSRIAAVALGEPVAEVVSGKAAKVVQLPARMA